MSQNKSGVKVVLTRDASDKLDEIVQLCSGEVGGLGYATYDEGEILVDDIFLVPQQVSSGGVDFDSDAISIGIEKAIEDDRLGDLRFSWHSHGSMNTFWSQTDEGGIRDYLQGGATWLLSIVTNHDGDILARLDIAKAPVVPDPKVAIEGNYVMGTLTYNKLPVEVIRSGETYEWAKAQKEQFVRPKKMVTTWKKTTGTHNTGGSQYSKGSGKSVVKTNIQPPSQPQGKAGKGTEKESESATNPLPEFRINTTSGEVVLNENEINKLMDGGCNLSEMSEDDIIDALIKIDLGEGDDNDDSIKEPSREEIQAWGLDEIDDPTTIEGDFEEEPGIAEMIDSYGEGKAWR